MGGISTVSMRYTVALAVCTPPQMTLASLTMIESPEPETVTSWPSTVACAPSISSGVYFMVRAICEVAFT